MAKFDLKAAYWNVPVHPDDRWLLGMVWENQLFMDVALPFGLRSAPIIFSALANVTTQPCSQALAQLPTYCKRREAGRGPGNEATNYLLSIFTADCVRQTCPDGGCTNQKSHIRVAHSYCNKLLEGPHMVHGLIPQDLVSRLQSNMGRKPGRFVRVQ